MAAVEAQAWPPALAATAEQIADRIEVFREGQWVAEADGAIVGVVFAQRISPAALDEPGLTYDALTDGGTFRATHTPHGGIYQIVGVGVSAAARGRRVGRRLVDRQIAYGRALPGVTRIVGFTRPAAYHLHADAPIEDYVTLRDDSGRQVDPVLAFHLGFGARFVSIQAEYRPEDAEAGGYGVLIEYP